MKISIWPVNTNSQDQIECTNAPDATIQSIINILSTQFSIPPNQIRLIAFGKILDPSTTISHIFTSNFGFMSMIVCKPTILAPSPTPIVVPDQPMINDSLQQLIDIGFDKNQAEQALTISRGNAQFAASILTSGLLGLLTQKLGVQNTSEQGNKASLSSKDLECIEKLKLMGFDEKKATIAYIAANKNIDLAIDGLTQDSS